MFLTSNLAVAQYSKLSSFDDKIVHFGFALSYNESDYYIQKSINFQFSDDSLQSLLVNAKPGFTLGVISGGLSSVAMINNKNNDEKWFKKPNYPKKL